MNDVPPAYILRPTARWAYCTGILRCACVTAMTPATTPTSSRIKATAWPMLYCDWMPAPGKNMSCKPVIACGNRATMPTVMTSEMPLPMPRSVICSPSHINSIVPTVIINTVLMRYHQM